MNEIELIRQQLESERRRAAEVAEACIGVLGGAAAPTPFLQACVEYLVSGLTRFEERDQRLSEVWRTRLGETDPERRRLEELLESPGRSREALDRLEAALAARPAAAAAGARPAVEEFARFFRAAWRTRRAALDALLDTGARTADWRAIAGLDADSIMDERTRYARVAASLPEGVSLGRGA